jgi:hypothetical protein
MYFTRREDGSKFGSPAEYEVQIGPPRGERGLA